MAKFARPLQLERGEKRTRNAGPMRSPQGMFARDASGGAALAFDAGPTVDWTASATAIDNQVSGATNVLGRQMGGPVLQDDQSAINQGAFQLAAGLWKVTLFPTVTHSGTGTSSANVRFALTSASGTAVRAESVDYTVQDGGRLTPHWIALVNLPQRQVLQIRAAQTAGDSGVLSIEEDTPLVYLEKVGNVDEV